MIVYDYHKIHIEGKGLYENYLTEFGGALVEEEHLDGVQLKEGHYCKHYKQARNFTSKDRGFDGHPYKEHYCSKDKIFMGDAYCCDSTCEDFEKGKSAGVKRERNKINKARMLED